MPSQGGTAREKYHEQAHEVLYSLRKYRSAQIGFGSFRCATVGWTGEKVGLRVRVPYAPSEMQATQFEEAGEFIYFSASTARLNSNYSNYNKKPTQLLEPTVSPGQREKALTRAHALSLQ